jgi:hypothetical protein
LRKFWLLYLSLWCIGFFGYLTNYFLYSLNIFGPHTIVGVAFILESASHNLSDLHWCSGSCRSMGRKEMGNLIEWFWSLFVFFGGWLEVRLRNLYLEFWILCYLSLHFEELFLTVIKVDSEEFIDWLLATLLEELLQFSVDEVPIHIYYNAQKWVVCPPYMIWSAYALYWLMSTECSEYWIFWAQLKKYLSGYYYSQVSNFAKATVNASYIVTWYTFIFATLYDGLPTLFY